jgi:phosphoribosyl-AMP cyclohydrolase (EC 3.5.4.19)
MTSAENLLNSLKFDANGLVTAIAQDYLTGEILMVAHMNRDSLIETLKTGKAVYWSRSRQKLWQKGEESGNVQNVKAIYIDCDGDAVVLKVEQVGGASCHTGHRTCFIGGTMGRI